MKIRSKSLATLLFSTTCLAMSFALLLPAPARSANILLGNYSGNPSPGPNWNGTASGVGGNVFHNIPTLVNGQTYQISFDAVVATTPTQFNLYIDDFNTSTPGTTVFDNSSLVLPGTTSFTRTFIGNSSATNLFFDYRFSNPGQSIALNNITIDVANAAQVPEPLTIIGTIIGGAAAIQMRNRLKASNKKVFSVDR